MFGFKTKPTQEWLDTAKQENQYTPDIAEVESRKFNFIFVYDEKMHRRPGYKVIEEHTVPMHTVYTKDKFFMYKHIPDGRVIPIPEGNRPIRGELHVTTGEGLIYLDKLYENGVEFLRQRVKVILPFRTVFRKKNKAINSKPLPPCLDNIHTLLSAERTEELRVWMYVAKPEVWLDRLDAGYTTERITSYTPNKLRSWLNEYYFYTEKRSE